MGDAKHKHRMVRFSDEDWKDLDETAQEIGSDRSAVIRQLVQAWMGRAGVRPPRRPAPRHSAGRVGTPTAETRGSYLPPTRPRLSGPPLAAELARERAQDRREDDCQHPKGSVIKGRCTRCQTFVGF
jgi:hypothetical protein